MELYHSPYEAYPFLSDNSDNLCCDFELLTDEMASATGLLRTQVADKALNGELLWLCELLYDINPTLRTRMSVTGEEVSRLATAVERLQAETSVHGFVLPQGCQAACTAHLLRVKGKCLVRLLYRHMQQGHDVPPLLVDACNLLSGYFFLLALKLNALEGVPEKPYISRNYS